jgi:hypothetical protein
MKILAHTNEKAVLGKNASFFLILGIIISYGK